MIHEKIHITLDCGIEVEVLAFNFGYTYGGILGGIPNDSLNQKIYDRFSYPLNWGEQRKHLKLEAAYSEFIPEVQGLKHAFYSVWVKSNYVLNKDNDGSHLIVTWLDNIPNNKTIEDIISQGIRGINWVNEADDFNY